MNTHSESAPARLIDESALRRLGRLRLIARRVRAGQMKGERRSTKRGTSIEFADYRDYRPGDDLRRIDWNVYARTERAFIKLHEEEEDLAVHILIDASQSMHWPEEGPTRKFDYARRLTAMLGHLALAAGDRLLVTALRTDGLRQYGPARGAAHSMRLFSWLDQLAPSGRTELNTLLRHYAQTASRPGIAIVITDLFSPSGFREGLSALQSSGYELTVVHTLSPDELEPPLAGDLRLIDTETQTPQDITLDSGLRDLYMRRVKTWQDETATYCRARDAHYLPARTDTPAEELVLGAMRRAGLVA